MRCWHCGRDLVEGARFCSACGHSPEHRGLSPIFVVDSATDLLSQEFLEAVTGQEITRALRYARPLSLIYVEMDHLEEVRQGLDGAPLDALARELGRVVGASVRDTDTLAYLRGDSSPAYAVLVPEADREAAVQAADKLRRVVSAHDFRHGGNWRRLTISVGVATVNHGRMDAQNLLQEARSALSSGRDLGGGFDRTYAAGV